MSAYAVTAQYYDPFASDAHELVRQRIAAALRALEGVDGPVVDVGAGTGLTSALIAATLPNTEIMAVEPDPAMRPALMTRVWNDSDLRRRVTILPFGILEAPLPDGIAGAVFSASLVHLGPEERSRLWPLLAERLAEGGRIIIEVQCPVAVDMAETEMGCGAVGRMLYSATASAERIAPDRQRWRMTYRASMGGLAVSEDVVSYDCWTISADQILEEAAAAGLAGYASDDLVIVERPRA